MKLLKISPRNRDGGIATYNQYLSEQLSDKLSVDYIDWDWDSLYSRGLGYKALNKTAIKKIRQADIIHIQYTLERFLLSFPVIVVLSRIFGTPILITQHEKYKSYRLSSVIHIYHQLLYYILDGIIVHTNDRKKRIWRTHHSKVYVIPHGVRQQTDTHSVPEGRVQEILFPGIIRPGKGYDIAIKAMKRLPRNYVLRIIGKPGNEEFVEEIRELASKSEVDDQIKWELGFLPEDVLMNRIKDAGLVILPYEKETTASGILAHCISFGTPTLVSDCPAFRSMISVEEAFFIPEDSDSLAEQIEEISQSSSKRRLIHNELVRTSRKRSWENTASKKINIYNKILE